MSKTTKSFVAGAAILGFAGLIVKIIGAFYRIPLTNMIGTEGMGIYQVAYPIYSTLLVISTSGIPTAISKMVAEKTAVGDYRNAHRIFQVAFRVLLIIGLLTSAVMLAGNRLIAQGLGDEMAAASIMAIAPALFFVSLLSAYRGYFQGLQRMVPTAASQVVEQIGKLAIGLYLAYQMYLTGGPAAGAAGALLGVTLSEVAALVLLIGMYNRNKGEIKQDIRQSPRRHILSFRAVLRNLAAMAIPITLGGIIMPVAQMIDTAMIHGRLEAIGYALEARRTLLGILTGQVNTLVNMPAVLTVALSMSLVPAISASVAERAPVAVRTKAETGLKLAILIGLPCAVGMYLMAEPILSMLYRTGTADEMAIAVELLGVMSIAVFFLSIVQTMTGVLQGLGKVGVPVFALLIGALTKVVVNYILLGIPEINIKGAAISTICCYSVAALVDVVMAARLSHMRLRFGDMLVRPLLSAGGMGVAVYFVNLWARKLIHSNTVVTILAIGVAAMVYVFMLLITKAVRPADMAYIPGGAKITRLLCRMHIWKTPRKVKGGNGR